MIQLSEVNILDWEVVKPLEERGHASSGIRSKSLFLSFVWRNLITVPRRRHAEKPVANPAMEREMREL
jgi:hypothetical protein